MTLACLIPAIAVCILVFMAIKQQYNRPLLYATTAIIWSCVVCGLIGMIVGIVFAADGTGYAVGAAGIVAIFGVIINVVAASLVCVLQRT